VEFVRDEGMRVNMRFAVSLQAEDGHTGRRVG
jgi:hypothetical protein